MAERGEPIATRNSETSLTVEFEGVKFMFENIPAGVRYVTPLMSRTGTGEPLILLDCGDKTIHPSGINPKKG